MKKIFFLSLLCFCLFSSKVLALTEVVEGSWATYNEGTLIDSSLIPSGHVSTRANLKNSLFVADATEENGREQGFTGIGYFDEFGVTYYFDKFDELGNKTHNSFIVGNPDPTKPDLTLTEVTWDGDASTWIGEGAEVWAVNYNGTGEDVLVAYAYNKLAYTRITNAGDELLQVSGAKIEFQYQSDAKNLYDTLIYFPDDFVYCSAIRLVDITESLKKYGGNGQTSRDGYDLDAMYGYKILYIPTEEYEYQSETAVAFGELNLNCENSWQKVVLKVSTALLKDGNVSKFDIIAGQHYKVGTGEVYLNEEGKVSVRYNFLSSYNLVNVKDTKVGIYRNYNSMLKNGKLLGNGNLVNDDNVTLDDEYAYIRLHFDVEIPTYLVDKLEYVQEYATVCEKQEEPKEESDNKVDCDKKCCDKKCCDKKNCDKKVNCNEKKDCNKKLNYNNKTNKVNKVNVKVNNCKKCKTITGFIKKISCNFIKGLKKIGCK